MDYFEEFVKPYLSDKEIPMIDKAAINRKVENEILCKTKDLKGDKKFALLVEAVSCMDLTSLGGEETKSNIDALCAKAFAPLKTRIEWVNSTHTAAVCVYPEKVSDAVSALETLGGKSSPKINIASVAAGFPSGQFPLETRLQEIREAIKYGATEIDVVIDRNLAITHDWETLYEELKEMREACKGVTMKTILSVGELNSWEDVYVASMIAMAAGSDFIKTSTGKEVVNATLPVGIVMCRAIKHFYGKTGRKIGLKPAGGIRTAMDALSWLVLVEEELGEEWLNSSLFRIGASSLLDDIVKNVESSL